MGKGWKYKASMGIPREARLHVINEGDLEQWSLVTCMQDAEFTYGITNVYRKTGSLRPHRTSEANQTGEEEAIIHLPIKKLPDLSANNGEF